MTPTGLFVGLATLDVVQLVDGLPARNQKTVAAQTWLAAGGPAAVAAITFAALGGRALLWTALGDAPAARLAASDLAAAGVEVIDAAPAGFELAVSTVLLDAATGERAVVSGSGNVPDLAHGAKGDGSFSRHLDPETQGDGSWLFHPGLESGAGVVLVDGHHAPLARVTASAAAAAGVPVVVDAGSHKPVFDAVFPLASDVICAADYVHPAGLGPAALLEFGPGLVAVSHGGGPVDWWTRDASGSITPHAVTAADSVGAGDVLHGAYSFGLASGLDRLAALELGIAAATERVRHLGPFAWRAAIGARR